MVIAIIKIHVILIVSRLYIAWEDELLYLTIFFSCPKAQAIKKVQIGK